MSAEFTAWLDSQCRLLRDLVHGSEQIEATGTTFLLADGMRTKVSCCKCPDCRGEVVVTVYDQERVKQGEWVWTDPVGQTNGKEPG